jgi:cytidyltransferase-like protein
MKLGVIIGRFQVPWLHPGHLHLIATAIRECDHVLILLGSSHKIDDRNPYNVPERVRMIRRIFPQVMIETLWDIEGNDQSWSDSLDAWASIKRNQISCTESILYHSRDSFKDFYKGNNKLREVEEVPGYSGTKLREDDSTRNT